MIFTGMREYMLFTLIPRWEGVTPSDNSGHPSSIVGPEWIRSNAVTKVNRYTRKSKQLEQLQQDRYVLKLMVFSHIGDICQ